MQQNAKQLLEDPARKAFVTKILAALDTNRLIFNTQKNIMMVVQSVTKKLNQPFAEYVSNPKVLPPELAQQIKSTVEQKSSLFLLNSLKQFDLNQIGQYLQMLQQPSMQLFQDSYLAGFENGLDKYASEISKSVGELFTGLGWNIAPYLSIAIPEGEDLTFQALDEDSPKLLVAWTGDTFDFYIEASESTKFKSFKKKWRVIEKEYKSAVDGNKILKIHKGSFTNPQGLEVQFKVTAWNLNGEPSGQVVFLIQNDKVSYIVVAAFVGIDKMQSITNRSIDILKTALLLK